MAPGEYFDKRFFERYKYVSWNSKTKNISAKQLFEDLTFPIEEVLERIEVHHTKKAQSKDQRTVIEFPTSRSMIQTQYYYISGKCYTFNPDDAMKQLGIESIAVWR